MQKVLFEILLIISGFLVSLVSLSFDWFYQGSPGVGFQQLIGITIGLIIILIGLRYLLLPEEAKWDWLLFGMYLSGVLFVGLWPGESSNINQNLLFGVHAFGKRDLVLNVAGFVPLGFLMLPLVSNRSSNNTAIRLVAVVGIAGFSVSFVIEALQYFWIAGRYSSANDLVANTFGAMIGATCHVVLFVRRLYSRKP